MTQYGDSWSTLKDELNRLANGGGTTYPPISTYLDVAGAIKGWAAARAVTLTKTDSVGMLNEIAGITDETQYLDFSGVCNYIAGTTWLPAAAALRQVQS